MIYRFDIIYNIMRIPMRRTPHLCRSDRERRMIHEIAGGRLADNTPVYIKNKPVKLL